MISRRSIFAVLVVVAAVALVIIGSVHREPRYQGRALSKWIADAQSVPWNSGDYYQLDPKWQAASNAVCQIGTNALPTLLKWAFYNPKPKPAVIEWLEAHFHIPWHSREEVGGPVEAGLGFEFLGNKVEPAWPILVQRTYNRDAEQRMIALRWLNFTSHGHTVQIPDRKTNVFLLPTALRLLKDPDKAVRYEAAIILMEEFPQEAEKAEVVPVISSLMQSAAGPPVVTKRP